MKNRLHILIFYYLILTFTIDHENIFTFQESNIVKVPVELNPEYIYRVNPFYDELVLIIVVKNTVPTNNLFNVELYIASFRTEKAEKLDSPVISITDYKSDIFWVKDYVVVFDQPSRKYYFLNESTEKLKVISMRDDYTNLLINMYYPEMFVVVYKDNTVGNLVSVNFGESYISLPLSVKEYCWIHETQLLATLVNEIVNTRRTNVLYVRNHLNPQNKEILRIENVVSFKVVERYIFIITKLNAQSPEEYFMYDSISNTIKVMLMPQNYQNPIFQSIYYDTNYIFIVLQENLKSCILRGDNNILTFKSIKCGVKTTCNADDCEFAFSNMPHVIYTTIYNSVLKAYETLYSTDDGDHWNRFQLMEIHNLGKLQPFNVPLQLIRKVKRNDIKNLYTLDIFHRDTAMDGAPYTKHYYSKDIGTLIPFDFNIKDISIINHHEMMIATRKMVDIVLLYYKIGNIYERIIIQFELNMLNPKYVVNDQYSTIILLHLKKDEASQKHLNILFFQIVPSAKYICDNSNYHVRDTVCKKGILYGYMSRNDDAVCFTPLNYEFVQILNHCPCSFEEYYCKKSYKIEGTECKPMDTTADTTVYCNNGKLKLSHMNGLRKILNNQCDYDFSKDDDDDQNSGCGYLDDPDYLKIILKSSSVTVYMDSNGKHFSKPPIFIESISEHPSVSKIWDYDVNMDVLYIAKENIILKVENAYKRSNEMKSQELFWFEEQITGIVFDKSSGSLFVSDSISNMYQISLQSNYKKRLMINGKILSFNKIIRTISYINEFNKICTQNVYMNSSCITLKKPVVYGHLDLETETSFILFSNKSLIVQRGITNYEFLKEILDVSFIRLIDNSLYFMSKTSVLYINVKNPSLYYKIVDLESPDISTLFVRDSYNIIHDNTLICDYINEVNNNLEGKCVCPTGAIQRENICECPNNLKYQKSLCLGFFCKNQKCLRNNIRCDGINDCGDSSDEDNCKKICASSEHLCKKECQSKNIICQEFNQPPNISNCQVNKIHIIMYIFIWVLSLGICFGLLYLSYRSYRYVQYTRLKRRKLGN